MRKLNLVNCILGLLSVLSFASCTKDVVIKETIAPVQELGMQNVQARSVTVNPTDGWAQQSFTFQIHKPYDLQVSDRYHFEAYTNTHTFWTYSTDKPHALGSNTPPRSEMMIKKNYTTGKHQFEADVCVSTGTNDASIMQVYGGTTAATAFMARVYNQKGGTLKKYNNTKLVEGIYDQWWHLNVIHDADANTVAVYKDGQLLATYTDNGNGTHYFKCGVYGATKGYAKAKFRNIKYWTKP